MNIFASSSSPAKAAKNLDDRRVNKMIVESAQMLSTALRRHGGENIYIYRTAYPNHPCTLWAGNTRRNFNWLTRHAFELCRIYESVYGREHATKQVLVHCYLMTNHIPEGRREPFVNCTPYKSILDDRTVIERYQACLNAKWSTEQPTWRNRNVPAFYTSQR